MLTDRSAEHQLMEIGSIESELAKRHGRSARTTSVCNFGLRSHPDPLRLRSGQMIPLQLTMGKTRFKPNPIEPPPTRV
jgi:hypothetical protein